MQTSSHEQQRLAALRRLQIINTPPEERYESLTRIARLFYGVDIALFNLVDEEDVWLKARQGVPEETLRTSRDISFCSHTISHDRPLVIGDTLQDPRFCESPLVRGYPHIRFYAGVPVREPTGFKIGTLCIMDSSPRELAAPDLQMLRSLAGLVEEGLELAMIAHPRGVDIGVGALNRSILRAQNVFLATESEHKAFDILLDDLLTLTGSRYGLIGEVQQTGDGPASMRAAAVTSAAWSQETREGYGGSGTDDMMFGRLDTLLARTFRDGELVISNDVPGDTRTGVTALGYPPITTYMGVPVFSGERLVGMIGLANRPNGYSERFAEDLAPLSQTVGLLIDRNRLQASQKEQQTILEQAANFDMLTGLPNRRMLSTMFEKLISDVDRKGGELSVCFVDLDGFKEVNDEHGHAVGDVILQAVAQRLKQAVGHQDLIARIGGDEFVAILRNVTDHSVYQRILDVIGEPIQHVFGVARLSGSMGITLYPEDQCNTDLMLRHADQAMYLAKEAGKNRFRHFDVLSHESRLEQGRVIGRIQQALENEEFELYLQPKVNFRINRVIGFELLIRWHHPEQGLLTPGYFLPAIENTELELILGQWVIGRAVDLLRSFELARYDYSLSINLSPRHFLGDAFADDLEQALTFCSAEARSRLILEILETTAMDDSEKAIEVIRKCRQLGVSISLDDFGTGFSSLSYFRRLPADEIKIDQSFVMDMLTNPEDAMIVEAVIGLSNSFRRVTVAEGIESAELAERLLSLGCELGQGFYFSKALPQEEALAWAKQYETAPERLTS